MSDNEGPCTTEVTAPVIAEDSIPTIDSPEPVATYKDWTAESTIVRTYFIGGSDAQLDPKRPVKWAATVADARAEVQRDWGRILEENHLPGRSYFRVRLRPTSSIPPGSSGTKQG